MLSVGRGRGWGGTRRSRVRVTESTALPAEQDRTETDVQRRDLHGRHLRHTLRSAGPGRGSLPVHRPLVLNQDHGSDGERGLPHRQLRYHREGVPQQRRHHLRKSVRPVRIRQECTQVSFLPTGFSGNFLRSGVDRRSDGRGRPVSG